MADETKTITPQVLKGSLDNILSVLIATYNDQVTRIGDKATQVPALTKLGQALTAMQQSESGVLNGQTPLKDWANWSRQSANALVACASQLRASGLDKAGDTVKSATAAKQSVDKTLAGLGLAPPNGLLIGLAALALVGSGFWAYKSMKKPKRLASFNDDDDAMDEGEGEGETVDLSDDDQDDVDDSDDDDAESGTRHRRWSAREVQLEE